MARTSSLNQEEVQFSKPQEPLVINVLKQEIFELQTLNRCIQKENQILKAQGENQIAKNGNLLLHLSLWYKKNKKVKQKNRSLKRQVINLKNKILIKNPRMTVVREKGKMMKLDVLS